MFFFNLLAVSTKRAIETRLLFQVDLVSLPIDIDDIYFSYFFDISIISVINTSFLATLFLLAFIGISMLSGCGGSDEPTPTEIAVQSFSVTISENPTNGQILGTLSASTNQGTLAYAISNQNPAGAFNINSTTGQIAVADASLFDFEARTSLTASFTASADGVSKSGTITVTLTDVAEITVTAQNFSITMAENPVIEQVIGQLLSLIHI